MLVPAFEPAVRPAPLPYPICAARGYSGGVPKMPLESQQLLGQGRLSFVPSSLGCVRCEKVLMKIFCNFDH